MKVYLYTQDVICHSNCDFINNIKFYRLSCKASPAEEACRISTD